jgi:hypothetical protein
LSKLNTTVVIEPVTNTIDSLVANNELTFRCYTFCLGSNCTQLSGIVNWYAQIISTGLNSTNTSSSGNFTLISTTSLSFSNNRLYSFLTESVWTNYINKEVFYFMLTFAMIS